MQAWERRLLYDVDTVGLFIQYLYSYEKDWANVMPFEEVKDGEYLMLAMQFLVLDEKCDVPEIGYYTVAWLAASVRGAARDKVDDRALPPRLREIPPTNDRALRRQPSQKLPRRSPDLAARPLKSSTPIGADPEC